MVGSRRNPAALILLPGAKSYVTLPVGDYLRIMCVATAGQLAPLPSWLAHETIDIFIL
jgi:hypothetical protein